ncbi:pyridoxal-phosphate dependent enzyme [Nitrospiraceae bacterium HYJII51-Mn-bac16s-1-B09]|uniref:Pyridoxal-phosphate dependent enzyme n=2 Tax=Candidatus Manganitrophus noduliformans TaxID=2606439 RepID=A0A7X6ICB7_9BACT|nr:pyridoxal-phosphate dependent enzyme [Candidatus Manganitrophus noduliformans]
MSEITFQEIQTAARRLEKNAHRTPVATSDQLNDIVGAEVFCKCENLQRVGAFKFRGAFNLIGQLSEAQRESGVVAFSSGNHAQAVALVAKRLKIPAVIVMPRDSPAVKLAATRGYGAEVILYDRLKDNREAIAKQLSEKRGLTLVPPFDHPHIIAGQGTVALEFLADIPDLDFLVAPIGGGGLISGCSIAAHAIRPGIRIVGVEPETANDTFLSLKQGKIISTPLSRSIADGLLSPAPGRLTFPVMQQHLESVALVTDAEIAEAVRFMLIRMKLLVEPSGAAGVAALMAGKVPGLRGKRVGVVLTGGNVDPSLLGMMLISKDDNR